MAAVKRILAILVLFVMPLQLSFAMAAEYCDIAKVDAGQHFGHHVHADAEKSKGSGGKGSAEKHCAFCQLGCAHATLTAPAVFVGCAAAIHEPAVALEPVGHSPSLFERPPKHALA